MKHLFYYILVILFLKLFIPIPPYIECNHLTIISKIEVVCDSSYKIIYYEIEPLKEDNGIKYHYKKYQTTAKDLLVGINKIEHNKNIYKEKAKIKVSCPNPEEIVNIIKNNTY